MTDSPIQYLVPAQGLSVLDPETGRPVPAEGKRVRMTPFWQRRVAEGSMVVGERPKPAPQPEPQNDAPAPNGDAPPSPTEEPSGADESSPVTEAPAAAPASSTSKKKGS